MGTFRLGPSTVKMKVICPKVAIESRSEPEKIFSGLCSSSVTAALALMTVIGHIYLHVKVVEKDKLKYTILIFCLVACFLASH